LAILHLLLELLDVVADASLLLAVDATDIEEDLLRDILGEILSDFLGNAAFDEVVAIGKFTIV
jgi:hypothetical protein